MKKLLLILLLPMLAQAAPIQRDGNGKITRSRTEVARFQHSTICPATGKRGSPCPGYVVDHRIALACGGRDSVINMQYQTIAAGKAKDKIERKHCGKTS